MFDTKIAIVVHDDLAIWQKLNVTETQARATCAAMLRTYLNVSLRL